MAAVGRQDPVEYRDGPAAVAELPEREGELRVQPEVVWRPLHRRPQLGKGFGQPARGSKSPAAAIWYVAAGLSPVACSVAACR